MSSIGSRIKQIREQNHMTQGQLASALGASRSLVASIESGYREPKALFVRSFSAYFGVREDWIRTGNLPIKDVIVESTQSVVVDAYFALTAELSPTFPTPEVLTKLLQHSRSYAQMFHYISDHFLNPADTNEGKRMAALFAVAFPDYQEHAEKILSSISEEEKESLRHPIITRAAHAMPSTQLLCAEAEEKKKPSEDEEAEDEEPKFYLPLLGGAAAGSPIYHPADDGDTVSVPERYADPDRYAVFQARGDSMEPRIPDGAFVIVEINATPLDGEMAVVMLCSFSDAEYVVKRVYVRGQKMILRSYNRKYMDMTVTADEVRSVYRVVDVVR